MSGEGYVDEQIESAGLSRRDVLKRSAIVGGLVWVAPTVLSSPAGATSMGCPPANRYAIKHNVGQACTAPGANPSTGNCAASAGFDASQNGCCLEPSLVQFTESNGGATHTYVLAAGVALVQAFGKCAKPCYQYGDPEGVVIKDTDPATGKTTVTISCSSLSHSEIIVCLSGSNLPVCP